MCMYTYVVVQDTADTATVSPTTDNTATIYDSVVWGDRESVYVESVLVPEESTVIIPDRPVYSPRNDLSNLPCRHRCGAIHKPGPGYGLFKN